MPFANISADPEQEYFSDGMTEQIITNLSQLQALKVIARTSVMKFKNTEKTIPEIGNELKVAYVLEGSVRKSGNRIRVTAQLIKADEGFHLWANDYDRELNDVFAVQDDVSVAIAASLLEALSAREVLNIKTKRPRNVQAYEFYIKGQYFHLQKYFGATYNVEYFKKSEEMFKKAIELDSNYALAYASLADLYDTYEGHPNITIEEKRYALEMEQKYIQIALNIEPNLAEVQVANGWVRGAIGDIDERYKSFKKAVQLNSNYAYGYYSLGRFFRFQGLYDLGIQLLTRAIELDPLDAKSYTVRAINYYHIGEFEKATSDYEKALEIEPDHLMALSNYGELLVVMRKLDKAEELLARCKKINPDYGFNRILRALILAAKGESARALKVDIDDAYKVMIYALLSMKEEVIEYLNNKPVFTYLRLKNLPLFDSLRDDVRFEKILAKQEKKYRENLKKYGR